MTGRPSFHVWASEHPTTLNARLRAFPVSWRPLVLDAMRLAYEAGWVGAVDQPKAVECERCGGPHVTERHDALYPHHAGESGG
jgi:hypothetical protein